MKKVARSALLVFDLFDLIHWFGSLMKMQSSRIERKQVDREGGEAPGCGSMVVWAPRGELHHGGTQWQGRQRVFSGAGWVSSVNKETS